MTLSLTDPSASDEADPVEEPGSEDGPTRQLGRRELVALVVVALLAAGGAAWWFTGRDDLPDGTAFRIGDQVVSAKDVDRRVDALEALYGVEEPADEDDRADFLRDAAKSIAVQIMLHDEAAERDIVIPAKAVDDTLQQLIEQRYPDGGRSAFVTALGELGATEDQVRQEISDQLLVSQLFDDVAGDVSVDEAELRDAFADREDSLATPVRRSLRNVVVADRVAAQEVLRRLRQGESFGRVARSVSLDSATRDNGGRLGVVAADDLESAYAEAAFAAPVGRIFGPVKTEYGWNVGLVERELPATPATYAGVRDALRRTVLAEKSLDKWRGWLTDVIADHEVTYADDYRPDDPDAVPDLGQAQVSEGE